MMVVFTWRKKKTQMLEIKKKIDILIISEILTIKRRMRHWRKYLQYFKPTKDQLKNSLIQKENRKKKKKRSRNNDV